jgi:integrase
MAKPRNPENRGLPARWQLIHGAYYYQVPPGLESLWDGKKKFRLGKTLPEAYRVWADRIASPDKANTIAQLLDRYAIEVIPTKAPKTQASNVSSLSGLRKVFGALAIEDIKPQLVYRYVDMRSKKKKDEATGKVTGGRTAAHREIEVLSHALTKAVEWGYLDRHPFKGEVRLQGEIPRDRYVEDWEVVECLALPIMRKKGSVLSIQAYIRIKLLTGLRGGDLLRLRLTDMKEDGIHVKPHKTSTTTGKAIIYEWSPDLRAAIDMAKDARQVHISPWLFCNKQGEGYLNEKTGNAAGWKSMWQRFMARVIKETKVTEHFTGHDLRAKCASDATTLEHARALLSHADAATTDRIYRRKAERVKPLR